MSTAASRRSLLAGTVFGLAVLGAVVTFAPDDEAAAPSSPQASIQTPSEALSEAASVPHNSAAAPPGTAPQASAAPVALPSRPPSLTPAVATLWERVLAHADHQQHPFVILDKKAAKVFVFDGQGALQGESLVLLGHAIGDDSVPGIGNRPIADIRPFERTTPAGRFVAEPGLNHEREDIVWIDYDAAVSMHRLRASAAPAERRPQRLASKSVEDNRISYGCVNVPPPFYDAHIRPTLGEGGGVIYVLPETRSLEQQFPKLFGREGTSPA